MFQKNENMANLLFRSSDLVNEIEALQGLAASFHDRTSFQLKQLVDDINGLTTQKSGSIKLEIPRDRPFRTRISNGEFEPEGKSSKRRVFGEVTGVWELEAREHKLKQPDRPGKRAKPQLLIGFTGLASTEVKVYDKETGEPIANWRMDIGSAGAPGCFFHTFASGDPKFPVPRHPNLFPTPMAAIGFVLSELFQDGWEREVSGATDSPNRWRSIQRGRLKAIFEWQMELIDKATVSPWLAIKRAKPSAEIFIRPKSAP